MPASTTKYITRKVTCCKCGEDVEYGLFYTNETYNVDYCPKCWSIKMDEMVENYDNTMSEMWNKNSGVQIGNN